MAPRMTHQYCVSVWLAPITMRVGSGSWRFASVNLQLPLPTRIVIGASHTLTQYWWVILGAIGAGVFGLNRYYQTAPGRLQIDTRSEERRVGEEGRSRW